MSSTETNREAIPTVDLECYRDAVWALHDPDVQRQYEGQWVVAHQQKVIAHGPDPQTVAEAAAQVARGLPHRVVFCAREDPSAWLKESTDLCQDGIDG
jgi:hypothetical protein